MSVHVSIFYPVVTVPPRVQGSLKIILQLSILNIFVHRVDVRRYVLFDTRFASTTLMSPLPGPSVARRGEHTVLQ
jgi:hypothetical protein